MLILAWDTSTPAATVALARDGDVLGESSTRASAVLAEADRLLREAGLAPRDLDALAVGAGPGSFTGVRIGLAAARALAFALGIPVAGCSTLDALAAGEPGALPVVDARRGEVFTLAGGRPAVCAPGDAPVRPGAVCVGDGAVRYRDVLEAAGASVPPDGDRRHVPWARHHALSGAEPGPAAAVEPLYLRVPDAERAVGA